MVRVLIIARTPPPYLGAPIMLQYLVQSKMPGVELHHLSIKLSADDKEIGKFVWLKLIRLLLFIGRVIHMRIVLHSQILYYAPELVRPRSTVLRDAAVLAATRLFFPKTVLHLHSSGYDELAKQLPWWQRWLLRMGLFRAHGVIRLSNQTPEDGRDLHARREYIVSNGISDPFAEAPPPHSAHVCTADAPLKILFCGMLCEAKGLIVLLEACGELAARGVPFHLSLVGPVESNGFAARLRSLASELKIEDRVSYPGVLTGAEKFAMFAASDVLCHPTHGRDTLPIMLMEAMAAALPIVSTTYSGVPSMVDDGVSGYLVAMHDARGVADRLAGLASDPALRQEMGKAGRARFLLDFTLSRHLDRMRDVFLDVAGVPDRASSANITEQLVPA